MNVVLALRTEGRRDYAELRARRDALMKELGEIRAEMHRLEDHAAIEGVDLTAPEIAAEPQPERKSA